MDPWNEEVCDLLEVSEWLEWTTREIGRGGVLQSPSDENSVLFAARSRRLATRIERLVPHLPSSLRSRLIEASIVYQCWNEQKLRQEKVEVARSNRHRVLPVVQAIRHVNRLNGEGRHHIFEASDGLMYIVKFPNSTRGGRALATEMICTELARGIGLPVPAAAIVWVSAALIKETASLRYEAGGEIIPYKAGPCFGSHFISDHTPTIDGRIPIEFRGYARNLHLFAGALAFDIWTLNLASRQALFTVDHRRGRRTAQTLFIDFSHCLSDANWDIFREAQVTDPPGFQWVAGSLKSSKLFSSWFRRIGDFPSEQIAEIGFSIPAEWCQGERLCLARALERLIKRRWTVSNTLQHLQQTRYFSHSVIENKLPQAPGAELALRPRRCEATEEEDPSLVKAV